MATNVKVEPVKIVRPTFLKTDDPKHIDTTYVVPRMSSVDLRQKREPDEVWRVTEVELEDFLPWLIPALRPRWPRMSEEGVISLLKAAIYSKTTLLVRTRQVVGLAESSISAFEPLHPLVRERFTRYREPTEDERNGKVAWKYPEDEFILVYRHMHKWAIDIKAREFRFLEDTNARVSTLDRGLPDVKARKFFVYPVEP